MANTNLGDITSANATAILIADGLFPAGIQLEQFSTDQSVSGEEVTVSEARMGVDGQMVAGYTPNPKVVSIMLEASSPSYESMAQIFKTMEIKRGPIKLDLVFNVPSIGKTFTYANGVMTSGTIVPAGKKILDPTSWKITFANLSVAAN